MTWDALQPEGRIYGENLQLYRPPLSGAAPALPSSFYRQLGAVESWVDERALKRP